MNELSELTHKPVFETLLLVALSLVLVGFNSFFVMAEFAIVKVRRTRLEELVQKKNHFAKNALHCVDHLDEYLSATQLGITVVSLALGWIGEESFHHLFVMFLPHHWLEASIQLRVLSTVASFMTITLLHVVLGELVPKNLAIQTPEKFSLWIATPLIWFYRLTKPLILLFTWLANVLVRLVGYEHVEEAPISEEELKIVVADSKEEGVLSESEAQIIHRALSFSDKKAKDIMVKAEKVRYISLARSVDENKKFLAEHKRTRFPLCRTDFNDVVGIVNMKDFHFLENFDRDSFCEHAHDVTFIDAETRQDQILKLFSKTKTQMAIVRDRNTRANLGIVTMTDVIEELVGEIKDEHGH
jgi:CBS domain containing-hemolysin-like protein